MTDQNFDEEIKKAALPVLVDFYADWCVAPQTKILQENGSQIKASQIVAGQRLPGLNNHTLGAGVVTKSLVIKDLGHCQKIILETGREIEVTDGHLLFGIRGWVAAKGLKQGEKLAVLPSPDAVEFGTDDKELILARLTGLLFTDGTLYYQAKNHYYEVSFSVGQEKDVKDLTRDLNALGFSNVRFKELTKQQEISGRKFTTHLYKIKCLSKDLFNLLKSCGVPVGAKRSQEYGVPGWIKNGNAAVKREFLRGFLGGDGPKVDLRMISRKGRLPYNHININDLEFHKDPDLENSGLKLAEEIVALLGDFGVATRKVFSEKDTYQRQDGKYSSIIHIGFKRDFETARNLVTKVGYAYAWQKESTSQLVGEFLRQIFILRNRWQGLYKKALELAASGLGYRRISRALGVNPLRAFMWIKRRSGATVAQHGIKFDKWLEEALDGVPSGFVWEKIAEVKPIFLPAVAKITVNGTQSFIANGILSHNCGPCKIMAPVIDEIAEEYGGKLAVGKLDVDANPKTAQKYSIMSIPTLILFKNSQPVKQLVGYQGKEVLVKEINAIV